MEDSCEIHSEDDKGHPEKSKKRIIKTRTQIEALEKFYEEHKYPTEAMKLELAESVGLPEKQVSGWFCHRRLKDKRILSRETYANGRQDRSSGVVQDRGSGFRQDSCGSTKPGDDKNFDHREAESRRLTGPEVSAAEITYEVGTNYRGKSNCMEDTSSRSSSSLRDACFLQNAETFNMETSRHQPRNIPTDFVGLKPRTGPSGYLKVKGQVENAAITAVKRQLGRHYRQDGPPLGVEFESLPPGAFESSPQKTDNEPLYAGDHVPALTPDLSKVYTQSNSRTGYGSISKTNYQVSDLDGSSFKRILNSAHPEYYFNQKAAQRSSTDNGDHNYPEGNSLLVMREGLTREMVVDSRENCKFMAKHGGAEIRTSTGSNNDLRSPYIGKVNGEANPRFTGRNKARLKIVEEEDLGCKPSNFISKESKYLDFAERELTRKVEKNYIYGDGTAIDEKCNQVRMKIPLKNETRVAKRVRDEAPNHQEYARKASVIRMASHSNHHIRPASEMRSSFTEDDDIEKTSSFEG